MIRYQSNKQALIVAALVILLCLVCLTGATLALFTSNIEDGTIGIITTSGNVQVDVVNKEGVSLLKNTLSFVTTRDEVLFEPGATFYTQPFRVKNAGDVTVNFRIDVSEDKDVDMKAFREAFEIYVATDPTLPATAQDMNDFVGQLAVGGESREYCLVIKMKESAGNKFQGATYDGIGITVYAVQGNVNVEDVDFKKE